ncbi:hypothetical protein Bca4012_005672 [Brassica carinata]|uniref:DNA-directed RNA polymerase III subunit RPC9 n=4 Tax=Brassica TaxID=3705 RepID=A0A816IN56_BRANA|nr:PREDICTED: uncharacterized protein LOC106330536 [Brassica oleracea var. oleracea]KAG2293344.1 hypothetical protein Bca52824_040013 [Brassica carinata]CAF1707546.1 unnamed protein product [Brassica napus]VDC95585.1 unnamed protein product [Brassica oleracea]
MRSFKDNERSLARLGFTQDVDVCRVKANAGALTNFEVLNLINSKGASKDTTRVIAAIARSEYKVCDYLNETVASTQTLESVTTFSDKCKDFKLAKAEILNIINIRPSVDFKALLDPIIEEPKERGIDTDGILELVQDLLPPLPVVETQMEKDQDETNNGEES